MMSFGRPPRPAQSASPAPPANAVVSQPAQEPASLKDALANAEKHVQELRNLWKAQQAAASVLQKETAEAGTQTSPRPAAPRRARAPSPLVLPDGRAGSLEARVHAACVELLTPSAQRHTHGSQPSSTVGRSRSFGPRTGAASRADAAAADGCLADSLQQALLETPAGARPAWLRSHRLETPLSSTSTVAPFSAYRHSSRLPAATSTEAEACTPPHRSASAASGAVAGQALPPARSLTSDPAGSDELQPQLQHHQHQQQQQLASQVDDVALGVPLEPLMEAFTPHTSAMRLRAAMQWMRLQLGGMAVAAGGGAAGANGNGGASPRRVGRQRRYSDSSVSPALKILLGASTAAPPAAGGGSGGVDYEVSDGASEGCAVPEQQLAELELGGMDAGALAAPHAGAGYSRASMGGGGGAVDLLMLSDEADVEADVFCLNPLFDGQQRRTEGGAPGRCIAPWQAGSPEKDSVASDSDDFGPYCGPAAGVLPFAAAAAVAGQPVAAAHQGAGMGGHIVAPVAAAPVACVGGGGLGGGGGVLRDLSHGLNLASRLAPAGKGFGKGF
ncbi:hypothetical protein HYH02_012879 [Chlamydomonas schloesseri]|uniref:Uncharacterized protein n=1 Tax=Chlamydomonas schloesseri TaxID=2026947 RepID=A0A835VYM4_9CHLO|nr:hypothetical protein HYH02_012879 [Chlamydomonas schloesseri]|eukprot:KAG2432745.1 hypothetical protein HYH02_012879 [Chlamydomonas schloesseri]